MDDGARERERLREAVERGELTPEQAAEAWPPGQDRAIIAAALHAYATEAGHGEPKAELGFGWTR